MKWIKMQTAPLSHFKAWVLHDFSCLHWEYVHDCCNEIFFFLLRTSGTIVKNIRCVLEDARIIRKEDLNEVRICCREWSVPENSWTNSWGMNPSDFIRQQYSHATCNSGIGRLLIAVSWQGMAKKKKKGKLLAAHLCSSLTDLYWPAVKQHADLDKLSI